ncbi:MAG: S-layer homology domain-containing protein [Oscillospiraceae bacterium]|nr:S-layer homology domain-containing protein [Oscillospiraceae bacterium]
MKKKRTALLILLVVLMLLTSAPPVMATYDTMVADDFEFGYYTDDVALEILNFYAQEATISPANLNWSTTRGRAAAYLVLGREPSLLLDNGNVPSHIQANRFSDVHMHDWAFPAITWAASRGWVNGIGGGRFNPAAYLTRQEYVAMLVRTFPEIPHSNINLANWFVDHNQISNWARPYVQRDNPATDSIMNTGRNRNILFIPTPFDVQSVNWLY